MSETRNGKGDSYRIPITDKKYKENYDKFIDDYNNMDNGTYVIDDNFKIVARRWHGKSRVLFEGKKWLTSEFYDKYKYQTPSGAEWIDTKFMDTDKEEQTGHSPNEMKDMFRKGVTPPKAKVKSKGKIHPTWMF